MLTPRGRIAAGLAAGGEPTPEELAEIEARKAQIRAEKERTEHPPNGSKRYVGPGRGQSHLIDSEIAVPDLVSRLPATNGAISMPAKAKTCPDCGIETGPGKRHKPGCTKYKAPVSVKNAPSALQRFIHGENGHTTAESRPKPAPAPPARRAEPEIVASEPLKPSGRGVAALKTIVDALADLPEDLAEWVVQSALTLAAAQRAANAEE